MTDGLNIIESAMINDPELPSSKLHHEMKKVEVTTGCIPSARLRGEEDSLEDGEEELEGGTYR